MNHYYLFFNLHNIYFFLICFPTNKAFQEKQQQKMAQRKKKMLKIKNKKMLQNLNNCDLLFLNSFFFYLCLQIKVHSPTGKNVFSSAVVVKYKFQILAYYEMLFLVVYSL